MRYFKYLNSSYPQWKFTNGEQLCSVTETTWWKLIDENKISRNSRIEMDMDETHTRKQLGRKLTQKQTRLILILETKRAKTHEKKQARLKLILETQKAKLTNRNKQD